MPANDRQSGPATQVVKVLTERRVTIPAAICACINWIPETAKDAEPVECIAFPGTKGGMQIVPAEGGVAARLATIRRAFAEQESDDSSNGNSVLAELGRFYGSHWGLQLNADTNHRRFAIPSGAVSMLFGGDCPRSVVLYAAGGLFEVWDVSEWASHVRNVAANLDDLER